jgi:hypothetical protein
LLHFVRIKVMMLRLQTALSQCFFRDQNKEFVVLDLTILGSNIKKRERSEERSTFFS